MSDHVKILVVDDDPHFLALTSAVLASGGYEVIEASTGKDALKAVARAFPDLVVLDVVLPDMSGFEVCRQIKADPVLRSTLVALQSGLSTSSEAQVAGLDMGADGYIVKGIPKSELLARVKSLVRIKQAEDALKRAHDELEQRVKERTAELGAANQRLIASERALVERLRFEELLSGVSARFANIPPDQVDAEIERGLGQVLEFFEVDRVGLLETFPDHASWEITHAAVVEDVTPAPLRVKFPVSIHPWAYDKLIRKGEVVVYSSLDELPAEANIDRQTWIEWGIRSNLIIPVVTGEPVSRVIAINSMKRECVWPKEFIPRLRLLGEILVNALQRAQMQRQLQESYNEIQELKRQLEKENIFLRKEVKLLSKPDEIVGESEAIKRVLAEAEKVAPTDSTVLILGETGTGKELIARHIHNLSKRKDRPLVTVNCASLPPALIENEIFGREKGAYTGALTRMTGRFEAADGSTLFLDEIAELPLEVQGKLLRVLEQGRFERLGSTKTIHANVRLIAATNRDLAREVAGGKFRSDLYYRLNVFPIGIPALRERLQDIPALAWSFVREFEKKLGKRIDSISKKSIESLQQYAWPGNIRELKNVIEHAMIVCDGRILTVAPPAAAQMEETRSSTLEDVERRHILGVLEKAGWRIAGKNGAAELLGMKRTTLQAKMRALGITRPSS